MSARRRRKPSKLLAVHSRFGRVADETEASVGTDQAGLDRERGGVVGPIHLAGDLKDAYSLDGSLLCLNQARFTDPALPRVVLDQTPMMIFEIGQRQFRPVGLLLIAHHRASSANLACATIGDNAVTLLLAPAFDRQRNRFLCGSGRRYAHQRDYNERCRQRGAHVGSLRQLAARACSASFFRTARSTPGCDTRCGKGRRKPVRPFCRSSPSGSQPTQRQSPSSAPSNLVA